MKTENPWQVTGIACKSTFWGDALHQHWQGRSDYFAGGNMFVYSSMQQVRSRDYKGPDFFVVTDVDGSRERHAWIAWEENGRYPDVIVELLSPTTKTQALGVKKDLYETVFKTADYFCVDPEDWCLRGWHRHAQRYEPLRSNAQGWLWSDTLQLWLGLQEGHFQGTTARWLRFFAPAGQLVRTAEESVAAAQAQAEAAQVRAEAAEAENVRLRAELARLRGTTSS
ncbi:MAG: Uma2 family endonuclease [Candidatus Tectimicrobiota bacterium]